MNVVVFNVGQKFVYTSLPKDGIGMREGFVFNWRKQVKSDN
jgi:hypothetical protein